MRISKTLKVFAVIKMILEFWQSGNFSLQVMEKGYLMVLEQ